MKTNKLHHLLVILTMILLLGSIPCTVLAEDYTATTMRLLNYEGTVKIKDEKGKTRTVLENVRFNSGETMSTEKDSQASVGLDSTKILTMDENSSVKFEKKSKEMKLTVENGEIFLDVQEKLGEKEKLDVKTSTMTIGIRGTIINVTETPKEASGSGQTTLKVLEGDTTVTYNDTNGNKQNLSVSAGNMVTVSDENGDGKADAVPEVKPMGSEDISNLVKKKITNDFDIKERLENAIKFKFNMFPADGDWTIEDTITLVAQSASKAYDGTPLTRKDDVLVYGLPEDFTCEVKATGTITDAGTEENPVGKYTIYNIDNEDVTNHFTNIEKVSGKLVVAPAPLYIWTGSAEKVYDGTPLTNSETSLSGYSHHDPDEPLWRNTAYVTFKITYPYEVQTLYCLSGVVRVFGTNPITGETVDITLRAGEKLNPWLDNESDADSIGFLVEPVNENELPDEIYRLYADNPDLMKQACKDTGWDIEKLQEHTSALTPVSSNAQQNSEDNLQTAIYSTSSGKTGIQLSTGSMKVSSTADGTEGASLSVRPLDTNSTVSDQSLRHTTRYDLSVLEGYEKNLLTDAVNVRINIDTDITDYSNRPLGSLESTYSPVVVDPDISITATGSQTEVGTGENSYSINWGDVNPNNYTIIKELGTLKVTAPGSSNSQESTPANITPAPNDPEQTYDTPITFTAATASKVYDGTPLVDGGVTASGLPDGYSFNAIATGTQTNAGNSENTVKSYAIFDKNGNDVTSKFTNITTTDGTLTVKKAPLTVTTGSAEKVFDGAALTNSTASLSGLVTGETATVKATGSVTDVGSKDNTYAITWGTANKDNYKITKELGTLTVTTLSMTFDLGGGSSQTYNGHTITPSAMSGTYSDGSNIEPSDVTYKEETVGAPAVPEHIASATGIFDLKTGDQVKITIEGQKDAGTYTIKPTVTFTSGKADNYEFSYTNNTMVIDPCPITVTTTSGEKVYDGTPLTGRAAIDGLADTDKDKVTITATGTTTDVASASNTYTIEWGKVNEKNYKITENLGTLTVTPLELTFDIGCDSNWEYWGGSCVPEYMSGQYADGTSISIDDSASPTSKKENSDSITVLFKLIGTDKVKLTAQGRTDAGTYKVIPTVDFVSGNSDNYSISYTNNELQIAPCPITIVTGTAEKYYDGEPLTCEDFAIKYADTDLEGLAEGDSAEIITTGTITEVGETKNTYKINWGTNTKSANYTISDNLGTLTVKETTELTIKTNSATKTYDGSPLTDDGITVTGLSEEDSTEVTVKASGTITDAGSVNNTYTIDWGSVDKNKYTLNENLGTLTVEKVALKFDIGFSSAGYEYWGGPIAPEYIDGTYANDDVIESEEPVYEEIMEEVVSSITVLFKLIGTDKVKLTVNGYTDAGTYTVTPTVDFVSGKSGNYSISYTNNTLQIDPCPLTIVTGSAEKFYDGEPLTCETTAVYYTGYDFNGLAEGDSLTVTATGTITEVGQTDNTYKLTWGTNTKSTNYTISEDLGTLRVLEKPSAAKPKTLGSAASVLTGINFLDSDTAEDILGYTKPVEAGSPAVNAVKEALASDTDSKTETVTEAETETGTESSIASESETDSGTSSGSTDSSHASGSETYLDISSDNSDSGIDAGSKTGSDIESKTDSGISSGSTDSSHASGSETDSGISSGSTDSSVASGSVTDSGISSGSTDSSVSSGSETNSGSGSTDSGIASVSAADSLSTESDISVGSTDDSGTV